MQHYAEVFLVLLFTLRVKQDLLYKYQNKFIKIYIEYIVHHTHKFCICIGQPKQHYYKLVVVVPCTKGSLENILVANPYLMVPRLQINLLKYFGTSHLIEQVIDMREWVSVLDSHFVQLAVIDAHLHRTILLIYEQYRCSQRRHTGSDIPFLYQLLQLLFEFHQLRCTHAVRGFGSRN